MEDLKQPTAPVPFTPTGDKDKDAAGQATYNAEKNKYDSDLAAYNTNKAAQEKEAAEKAASDKKQSIDAINADKDLSPEEKQYAINLLSKAPSTTNSEGAEISDTIIPPTLTEEDKGILETFKSIQGDPIKLARVNAILNDTFEETIIDLLPKGEDVSKLTDEQVYERSLQIEGENPERIKKLLAEFPDLKASEQRQILKDARKTVSESSSVITTEKLNKGLIAKSEAERKTEAITNQLINNAGIKAEDAVKKLIGKEFNGITITNDDFVPLLNTIAQHTPTRYNKQKQLTNLDVDKGIQFGLKAYAFDKVIASKDKKMKDMQADLDIANSALSKRFRVSDGMGGGNSISSNTAKKDTYVSFRDRPLNNKK